MRASVFVHHIFCHTNPSAADGLPDLLSLRVCRTRANCTCTPCPIRLKNCSAAAARTSQTPATSQGTSREVFLFISFLPARHPSLLPTTRFSSHISLSICHRMYASANYSDPTRPPVRSCSLYSLAPLNCCLLCASLASTTVERLELPTYASDTSLISYISSSTIRSLLVAHSGLILLSSCYVCILVGNSPGQTKKREERGKKKERARKKEKKIWKKKQRRKSKTTKFRPVSIFWNIFYCPETLLCSYT